MNERFVVVDIETTGHSVLKGDRMIQIGAIIIENREIIERFSTFINPKVPIPPFIEQLTGITDSMVKKAPTFELIAPELLEMLDGAFFVAHNVAFDLSFLQRQLDLEGYHTFEGPILDTVELSRLLLPNEESYKLGQLADKMNLEHDRPHQADSDAEVTAELLLLLLEKLEKLPLVTLQKLEKITKQLKSDLQLIIKNIVRIKLNQGLIRDEGFDIFREFALQREKPEEELLTDEIFPFTAFKEQILLQASDVVDHFRQYEVREGQLEMMEKVDEALLSSQHLLIEAGTGTGKTLGYLIPSLFFSKQEKKPVIISTYTIPLQQQILDRDVPLLIKTTRANGWFALRLEAFVTDQTLKGY